MQDHARRIPRVANLVLIPVHAAVFAWHTKCALECHFAAAVLLLVTSRRPIR